MWDYLSTILGSSAGRWNASIRSYEYGHASVRPCGSIAGCRDAESLGSGRNSEPERACSAAKANSSPRDESGGSAWSEPRLLWWGSGQ
jgi:hypothetical protein